LVRIARKREVAWRLTKTLLAQRDALQFLEAVFLGSAVDGRVLQQLALDGVVVDGGLGPAILAGLFQLPRVPLLVVHQARVVVALVEELEDGREDFGFFVGQRDLLGLRVHQLVLQDALEEGRSTQDVLVGGEDPLLLTDDEGDDSRNGTTRAGHVSTLCAYSEDVHRRTATYPRVDSDAPALETVPARRRPDSTGRLEMPASLVKDELALRDLPDLEVTLLV
jgi:hypothetical protein